MALKRLPQSETFLSGTLQALLTVVATTMNVDNPPSLFPTYIQINPDGGSTEKETVRAISASGSIVTIERGVYSGGVGKEHQSNTAYKQKVPSAGWQKLVEAIENGYLMEDSSLPLVRVDADTFTIEGIDATDVYKLGRVVRFNETGSSIGIVASSSYSAGTGKTTVELSAGAVPTPLTDVEFAIQPTGATDQIALASSVQNSAYSYDEDAESSDTYAITLTPIPTAYTDGMMLLFKANTVNTGPATLNVNSIGAKSIKKNLGEELANGDIMAGQIVIVVYDSDTDAFQLVSRVNADGWVDLSDSATVDIDFSLGKKFRLELGGNRTLTISDEQVGQMKMLELRQDGTGSRIPVFPYGTTTFATTDVDITDDEITVGIDIPTATPLVFATTDTLPAGLSPSTTYYAIRVSATVIKVATSIANAQAGTQIDITDVGVGTHSCQTHIRWDAQEEPELSTDKYLRDRYLIIVDAPKIYSGIVINTGSI